MKKTFVFIMVLFLGLVAVACGGSDDEGKTQEDLKVALDLT